MKISTVDYQYVYSRLGAGKTLVAVDFKKMTYIEIAGQTIAQVNFLINRAKNDKDVLFFQIDTEGE